MIHLIIANYMGAFWVSKLSCDKNTVIKLTTEGLFMSPVDRAGPVSEISPHSYFLFKNCDVFT